MGFVLTICSTCLTLLFQVFAYVCPESIKSRLKMMYSSSKSTVIKVLADVYSVNVEKSIETSDPADINDNNFLTSLYPPVEEHRPQARIRAAAGRKFTGAAFQVCRTHRCVLSSYPHHVFLCKGMILSLIAVFVFCAAISTQFAFKQWKRTRERRFGMVIILDWESSRLRQHQRSVRWLGICGEQS